MIEQNGSYLGRYQAGDMVPLRLACLDRDSGGVRMPDQAPWLRVYGANGSVAAKIPAMPVEDPGGLPGLFKEPLYLTASYAAGPYFVVYNYVVNRQRYSLLDLFEVVDGGDASGAVISLYGYHHPESNLVFAQLTSRRLVVGRNPKV